MVLKSNFRADLDKEQRLSILLDKIYAQKLKNYNFKRTGAYGLQLKGVDLLFIHKKTKKRFYIDEKAQLDYVNEDLPTFAFELSYLKNETEKKGWLFDEHKKTDFYALITAIFLDAGEYSSCKITLVNRKKLLQKIKKSGLDFYTLNQHRSTQTHGPIVLNELNQKNEGYLFLSSKNKVEQPLNLILRLDWLLENKIAKRLI